MSVHEKIKLVRQTKGLTQEEVAEKLNMSTGGYGDIERGDCDIKLSKLQKIAEILEMELPELVDLSEKGTINIKFSYRPKRNNVYIGSQSAELEKQLLINEMKDKEIAMQQREIENLQEIIALLKREPI